MTPHDDTLTSRARLIPRYFSALGAALALGLSCAKSPGPVVEIGNGSQDASVSGPLCESGGVSCGEGCCASNQVCAADRCVPAAACRSNADCGSDSFCSQVGRCLPNAADRVNQGCRVPIDLGSLTPVVQCSWPGTVVPTDFPERVQVASTPMVMDLDLDNNPNTHLPSIVFVSYEDVVGRNKGTLRIIDGKDCKLQLTLTLGFDLPGRVAPAIADLDPEVGDGPEIIVSDVQQLNDVNSDSRIAAYKVGLQGFTEMWAVRSSVTTIVDGLAVHDIDLDGTPEVLTESLVLRGIDGQALNTLDKASLIEVPLLIDVNRDKIPELVSAQGIFSWNALQGRTEPFKGWNTMIGNVQANFLAAADLGKFNTFLEGGPDSAEIVMVGNNSLWVKRVDGGSLLEVLGSRDGLVGGPP
jgi:hypothetical protein